jgi:electron transfer flavoprotein alpha subunit
MAKGVWIVAEQRYGAYRKISFELASTARKLANQLGEEANAILLGSGIEGIASELGKYGIDKVYTADNAVFEPYTTRNMILPSCFWALPPRARICLPALWASWRQEWQRTAWICR